MNFPSFVAINDINFMAKLNTLLILVMTIFAVALIELAWEEKSENISVQSRKYGLELNSSTLQSIVVCFETAKWVKQWTSRTILSAER